MTKKAKEAVCVCGHRKSLHPLKRRSTWCEGHVGRGRCHCGEFEDRLKRVAYRNVTDAGVREDTPGFEACVDAEYQNLVAARAA